MSVISKLYRGAIRAERKAERLERRGLPKSRGRIQRLRERAAFNREVLNSWDDERWG